MGHSPVASLCASPWSKKGSLLFVSLFSILSLLYPPCFCSPIFPHLGRDCKSWTVTGFCVVAEEMVVVMKFIGKMMQWALTSVISTRKAPLAVWRTEILEIHTEHCSFSCGTLFRTQITSQVEESVIGYLKLENAMADVDINSTFRDLRKTLRETREIYAAASSLDLLSG